jgi:hypothetical protein
MHSLRSSIGSRAADVALRERRRVFVATLLPVLVFGCARPTEPETRPRVVLAGSKATEKTMDSVSSVPLPVASSKSGRGAVTVRLRPVTADTSHGPPMFIVDGHALGLREDGTIDHSAAQHALSRIDPRSIASIQVLKGVAAVERYGLAASNGVALIELIPHASRAHAGSP